MNKQDIGPRRPMPPWPGRRGGGERPKLMFVVSEDWYFVSHRLPLARAAQDAGFEVSVATRVRHKGATIAGAGLALHPLPFNRAGMAPLEEMKTFAALVQLYRRERPDIVHHVALKPVIYGALAARLGGIRHVVNALGGLGYVFRSEGTRATLLRRIATPLLRYALNAGNARLIVQIADDRDWLVENHLITPENVHLIAGSGVEMARYSPVDHHASPPLIILPARLLYDKGVGEFVEAARRLRRLGVNARFALVGQRDPANPACVDAQELEAWKREGVVELWGWREDMPNVLAQAQIVCLPSYHEGVPKALLEAAASQCAIVASDIPGCRVLVRPGKTGWLVPPRDATALATTLRKAIEDAHLRQRYGAAAQALVAAEFSMTQVAEKTLELYWQALASGTERA